MADGALAIQPNDRTLKQLFLEDFWDVPEFQREYVWRAKKEVKSLVEDLVQAFREDLPDYFLGSVVYFKNVEGTRELVDGQQRLTTLLLLIAALRDSMNSPLPAMDKAIRDIDSTTASDALRFRIELQYSEVTTVLEKLCSKKRSDLTSGVGGPRYFLVHAYDQCINQLSDEFGEDADEELTEFWKYLWLKAHVVTIETPNLKSAYKIFETLNDRGKALNASDLLRNYLFRSSGSSKSTQKILHDEWKSLVEVLRSAGESTQVRFLRYYLMSTYGLTLEEAENAEQAEKEGKAEKKTNPRSRADIIRADALFEWIVDNDSLLKASVKPEIFARNLREAGEAYANFLTGKDINGKPLAPLANITFQKTGVRQHLCLLLAGRSLPSKMFARLADALETLTLCFAVAGVPWNTLEKHLPSWSSMIRQMTSESMLDRFIEDVLEPEIAAHGSKFWEQMDRIYASSPSLARYVLARLTAYAQAAAVAGGTMAQLMDEKGVSVEHILPRSLKDPVTAKEDNWVDFGVDTREAAAPYVEQLGNLCLVGWGTNSQLSDHTYASRPKDAPPKYEVKKDLLAHVPWLLTYAVAGKSSPTKTKAAGKPSTGKDKFTARYGMSPPALKWNSAEVERRHKYLRQMIQDLWPLLPAPAPTAHLAPIVGTTISESERIRGLIDRGETDGVEFKSSFRYSYDEARDNKAMIRPIVEATCAFMNTNGGVLIVGVADDGSILGLSKDLEASGTPTPDALERHFRQALINEIGGRLASLPKVSFPAIGKQLVCRIDVPPAPSPAWLTVVDDHGKKEEILLIRSGGSSRQLDAKRASEHVNDRW